MKVGLFDSGIGGLTCLKALVDRYPHNSYVYLGDTARLPYGTKSPETIRRYVEQNIDFLQDRGVDLLISACHSASSAILHFTIRGRKPLFEVISPSCRALENSQGPVGILATASTVNSQIYPQLLKEKNPKRVVAQQACPLLVPLVENGWVEGAVTEEILKKYLTPLLEQKADAIVLGCTHYPILTDVIQKLVGPKVRLINPAQDLANELASEFRPPIDGSSNSDSIEAFLTDHSPHFLELAAKLLGKDIADRIQFQEI